MSERWEASLALTQNKGSLALLSRRCTHISPDCSLNPVPVPLLRHNWTSTFLPQETPLVKVKNDLKRDCGAGRAGFGHFFHREETQLQNSCTNQKNRDLFCHSQLRPAQSLLSRAQRPCFGFFDISFLCLLWNIPN